MSDSLSLRTGRAVCRDTTTQASICMAEVPEQAPWCGTALAQHMAVNRASHASLTGPDSGTTLEANGYALIPQPACGARCGLS